MTADDHEELLATLPMMAASIVLSGFAHPSYGVLEEQGFERFRFSHHVTASLAPSGRRPVQEVIWRRVAAGQERTPTLWDQAA